METKKSSTKQWLLLGAVFIIILFIFAYITRMPSVQISGPLQTLASAVFGVGGLLFLGIGIIRFIIDKKVITNMNKQKGFLVIILVTLIVVLIGMVGYFAFLKKSEPVAQQPSQTVTNKNETINWKTYKNDTYSFEIKYPSDWISKGFWSENGGFFYVAFGTVNLVDSKPLATLRIYPNQTTLDKFIKYFDYVGGTWKDTTLGGLPAKEVVAIGQNSQQFILVTSVKNRYGYELASTAFGDNVDIVKTMNSTFQFLK